MAEAGKQLRAVSEPFVAAGPSGVAVRDRLKGLTPGDEEVLQAVGGHLGRLASSDLRQRCADGNDHGGDGWAARKQGLTAGSSSRWAGSVTKHSNDQWALARRCQAAHIQDLEAGVRTLRHRLSRPIGEKGSRQAPGGYQSKSEWFQKSRRLAALEDRLEKERADRDNSVVHVVRGGRRLLRARHNLQAAQLTEAEWRQRWEAARWFLAADGESGKRHGNETIRVTPDGEASIRLPAPLAHLANAEHGRYVLSCRVAFAHRGAEWRDRVEANQAVAYRIHYEPGRGRWYLTASWQRPVARPVPLEAARAGGVIGVDTNADHFAAYRLDACGNPAAPRRTMTRHDAAAVAIGRRALGHPIRRRTKPPRDDQSDRRGHRTAQAGPGAPGREGTRHPATERAPDARRRTGTHQGTRATSASRTVRDARSNRTRAQDPLLLTD